MIYTSYFAKIRKMPSNMFPISIATQTPAWWKSFSYKGLAPTWDILREYKATGDEEKYTQRYYAEVLNKLDVTKVLNDLNMFISEGDNIVLCCYETPEKFCHRHLVANWLNKQGIECKEYETNNT